MITSLLFLFACDTPPGKGGDSADSSPSGLDADGDGYIAAEDGGDDCDDSDASIHPGATDAAYDGIDSDCAGDSDYDADHDGHDATAHGGDDCDDADPSVNPSAEEVWYDGFDQNCDGADDYDQDGDGYAPLDYEGEDCDDTDPESYPGAYDLPNDEVDQDCDGEDRSLDGVVIPEGETLEFELEFDLSGYGGMDVLVLMDTTCSMGTALSGLSFEDIDDEMSAEVEDMRYAFATFDDYAYSGYGSVGSDLPFILRQQLTDDLELVQTELDDTSLHNGADGPESSFEALYQSLTGAGYDQECDGAYDSDTDVLPFRESASDAFAGAETGSYDSSVSGTGTLGGVGFRATSLPVIVYVTDNYMRDPDDSTYGAPGGCSQDAGTEDVVAATEDLGAFLVGIATSSLPNSQMRDLAEATDSLVDTDDDGTADTEAVYSVSSSLSESIVEALTDVSATVPLTTVYEEVSLGVTKDTYALVTAISPESYSEVDTADEPTLTFTVTVTGTTSSSVALTDKLKFELLGDGRVLDTAKVDIEIPPG